MIVRDFLSDFVMPVKPTDSAGVAMQWMGEYHLAQLPIVEERKLIGIISEDAILDTPDPEANVSEIRFRGWDGAFAREGSHVYDALNLMTNLNLEVAPVLNDQDQYVGVVTIREVATGLSELFAVQSPGGVMVLQVPANSYVLSEIGRIVESEGAKVLSLYLSSVPGSGDMLITLKLNVEDLSRIVSSFNRFEYQVVHVFHRSLNPDDYKRNYDALIRYLDI
ncbi:CBS domain-containing protein [Pontibacter sp. G13]|uniref:CBS domain-containing protein n=1 Tax=Pontibacter sp. G13 TaxID=3074898 RepID=UPI00288C2C71|nr:CBS domain-containing protein [Pontibacter sp. G13]WNJ16494.1 CBS domain-containing protein [Pontibacter sp. G13]